MITWVAGKLASKAAPYAVIALAALVVLLWGWGVVQGLRLAAAQGDAAKAQAALSLCADANSANAEAIVTLQGNLNECVGTAQRVDLARREMEQARRDLLDRQERELRALRAQRDRDYASDAECSALRTVPVCRGVAERLRSLAGQSADG